MDKTFQPRTDKKLHRILVAIGWINLDTLYGRKFSRKSRLVGGGRREGERKYSTGSGSNCDVLDAVKEGEVEGVAMVCGTVFSNAPVEPS